MKALIKEGKVVQLSEETFDVHSDFVWVTATDDAELNGTYDGTSFGPWDARTADEKAADELSTLRSERSKLLKETDWWGASDHTMTDAQRAYRQALRDITTTGSSMDTATWPVKP